MTKAFPFLSLTLPPPLFLSSDSMVVSFAPFHTRSPLENSVCPDGADTLAPPPQWSDLDLSHSAAELASLSFEPQQLYLHLLIALCPRSTIPCDTHLMDRFLFDYLNALSFLPGASFRPPEVLRFLIDQLQPRYPADTVNFRPFQFPPHDATPNALSTAQGPLQVPRSFLLSFSQEDSLFSIPAQPTPPPLQPSALIGPPLAQPALPTTSSSQSLPPELIALSVALHSEDLPTDLPAIDLFSDPEKVSLCMCVVPLLHFTDTYGCFSSFRCIF